MAAEDMEIISGVIERLWAGLSQQAGQEAHQRRLRPHASFQEDTLELVSHSQHGHAALRRDVGRRMTFHDGEADFRLGCRETEGIAQKPGRVAPIGAEIGECQHGPRAQ